MKKYGIFAVVMLLGGSAALASTLSIPFFRSVQTGNDQSLAFIGVKNNDNSTVTISGTYTALDLSGNPVDQTFTFNLGANESVSWEPVLDDAAIEGGAGAAIPNMTHVSRATGSLRLATSGVSISGRYTELKTGTNNNISAFAHVALP